MSTLDAQLLTLSSMLVRDCMDPNKPKNEVRIGRLFAVVLAALTFALAQWLGKSVFEVAFIAFCGYVTLVPTLFLGVRWRRFTVTGAVASLVLGNLVYFMGLAGWLPLFGFLPVFWALVVGIAAAVLGSLWSQPADSALTEAAFGGDAKAPAHSLRRALERGAHPNS
jgi:Na+/proline symporter